MSEKAFHIFTVGWEPSYIRYFALPIAERTGYRFTYGLVGDSSRLPLLRQSLPQTTAIALSKSSAESLPAADYELLASLEASGVPTVRSMVQGDRVLRHRPEAEAFGYATLLARRIRQALAELQPDVVLATFDSLHSAMSLAVSKSMGIPWVALSYPVIPDDLTGFCKGMTPDTLVPLGSVEEEPLRLRAAQIIRTVQANSQKILAYRPPVSFRQRARQAMLSAGNFARRMLRSRELGYDPYTWESGMERFRDKVRRSINAVRFPLSFMIGTPPQGRFAYFPLHMAPESSVDTWAPFYQKQLSLVFQLALALPADVELVVKIHFGDPDNYSRRELLELSRLPRVRIARPDASSHSFLKAAAIVFGIQGTANLEAALLGKPVLLFGDSPYVDFPRTQKAKAPDELPGQIRAMLRQPPPSDTEVEAAYAAYIARYMPGRINDWERRIEPEELDRLCDCFRELRRYLDVPGNRADWYLTRPFLSE